jgi:hypothetical protein
VDLLAERIISRRKVLDDEVYILIIDPRIGAAVDSNVARPQESHDFVRGDIQLAGQLSKSHVLKPLTSR